MNGRYDSDTDTLWVLPLGTENFSDPVNDYISLFKSEDDEEQILGFELLGASEQMEQLVHVPLKMRLAGLLILVRQLEGMSQEQFASETGIGIATIKRAETIGDYTLSLSNLYKIIERFPQYDFSVILKKEDSQLESA